MDDYREKQPPRARYPQPGVPRFLVDEMLGRLGRWLRVLGYDAEAAGGRDDAELVRVAEREGRVLLTRDTGLVQRRAVGRGRVEAIFIRDDHLEEQLRQLRADHGITQVGPPRCLVCNGPLLPVARDEIGGSVPPYVFRTHRHFRRCPTCHRVVWQGTHWDEMRSVLAETGILPGGPSPSRPVPGTRDTHRPALPPGKKE